MNEKISVSGCSPVSFSSVANSRIERVEIKVWKGDGISSQNSGNLLMTDNTVACAAMAFQPNTSIRAACARNLGVGNRSGGLNFHLYNKHSVFLGNTFDSITGYPDMGDVFTVIAANVFVEGMKMQSSYNGLFVGNTIPDISLGGKDPVIGEHLYRQAPRHLVIAANAVNAISATPVVKGCVCAANRKWNSPETPSECTFDATTNAVDLKNDSGIDLSIRRRGNRPGIFLGETLQIPVGASRLRALEPVPAKLPVVDARDLVDPTLPDLGLQKCLDRLGGEGGGTLLLPGGRYALGTALNVPPGTTLAGHGIGSILVPQPGYAGSLIRVASGTGSSVRHLTIIGTYGTEAPDSEPAIGSDGAENLEVRNVDVRGWSGAAFHLLSGSAKIVNCRTLFCAGDGFFAERCRLQAETSIADSCRAGFRIMGPVADSPRIVGCVAGRCSGDGFVVEGADGALIFGNTSSLSSGSGFRIRGGSNGVVIGNQANLNNLSGLELAAGIVIEGDARKTVVAYNSCSDDQIFPTQIPGILETETVSESRIVGNLTTPVQFHPSRPTAPSLVTRGKGTFFSGNVTQPFLPGGSSIEFMKNAGKK
jgi:parallel beta-helix repeat protein